MASITQSSEPDIPDNHRESWLALLSAAEVYCQKSGCDLAILTACKKFRLSAGGGGGGEGGEVGRKRESGGGGVAFPRECDFSYSVWGQGFLAESARRYMDDIGVLHSTTMLTAQKHTRQVGGDGAKLMVDLTSDPGHRGVSVLLTLLLFTHSKCQKPKCCHPTIRCCLQENTNTNTKTLLSTNSSLVSPLTGLKGSMYNLFSPQLKHFLCQSFTGDGGVGGVSPNGRLYSQSYPSIYSSGAVTAAGGGQNGNGEREREKSTLEAERGRQRAAIADLEEECEDEEEEEDMDERRPYGNESAGEERHAFCQSIF